MKNFTNKPFYTCKIKKSLLQDYHVQVLKIENDGMIIVSSNRVTVTLEKPLQEINEDIRGTVTLDQQ